ncbi:hypothetical protein KMF05_001956 [Salmonella enterica subsp. enterica serovar Newport]
MTIVGVNLSKVLPDKLYELSYLSLFFFILFLVIGILLNIASIMKSLGSMAPFIKESEKENNFSFVDIVHYYKDGIDYFNKLSETKYLDLGQQLAILNYTLSNGLINKYNGQNRSILYLKLSLLSFFTSISIPWVELSLGLFKNEENSVIVLSLIIIFLLLIIVLMMCVVYYLLLIGRKTK